MKTKKAFLPLVAAALLLTLGLTACGSNEAPSANPSNGGDKTSVKPSELASAQEEVKSIKVTAADNKRELQIGETVQLSADVEGVKWSTTSEFVTVSDTGLVTAVAAGSARITAKLAGYENGSITITVVKAPEKDAKYKLPLEKADHYSPSDIWGMDLSAYGMGFMGPGDSPVEENSGATADGTSLGWLQKGCKETLTFTSDKAAKVELGVMMAYNAEMDLNGVLSVKFNGTEISMTGRSVTAPEDTSNYYEFHNVSFGQVDLVAGNNVLEIEMLAQAPNMDDVTIDTTETLTLTVIEPVRLEKIKVAKASLEVNEEGTVQIESETTGLTYESSDATIATVSATGLVTGVKAGSATITVSKEGMKSATVAVKVNPKPVEAAEGQILIEAEDSTYVTVTGGQVESKSTASGGKSVGYLSADTSVTITVSVEEAGTYKFAMNAGSGNADWTTWPNVVAAAQPLTKDIVTLTVNGTEVSIADKVVPEGSANPAEWFIVELADINLVKGENTIVFSFAAQGPNIDYFLISK